MKSFIVFAVLVAAALAAPASPEADAQIIKDNNDNIGTGPHQQETETSNGIKIFAQGNLKNVGTENEAQEVTGEYSYTGPDGILYHVSYIANEFGFQPKGIHLPQAQN